MHEEVYNTMVHASERSILGWNLVINLLKIKFSFLHFPLIFYITKNPTNSFWMVYSKKRVQFVLLEHKVCGERMKKVPKLFSRAKLRFFGLLGRNLDMLKIVDWRNGMIRTIF